MEATNEARASGLTSPRVGAALKDCRVGSGRTLAAIARRAQLHPAFLRDIEEGRAEPPISVLGRIARALRTDLVPVAVSILEQDLRPMVPPHTLDHVGSVILSLPVAGSRIEAATSAAVREAMRRSGGNQSAAARLLGMERKAFVRKLAKAGR